MTLEVETIETTAGEIVSGDLICLYLADRTDRAGSKRVCRVEKVTNQHALYQGPVTIFGLSYLTATTPTDTVTRELSLPSETPVTKVIL